MRRPIVPVLFCAAMVIACGESDVVGPSGEIAVRPRSLESGTVLVFVHWEQQGLPDKRVQLVELGIELTTDDAGLAKFAVPIGDYTVRVYEINRGGPPMHQIDEAVTVTANDEIRVDVVDCIPCV